MYWNNNVLDWMWVLFILVYLAIQANHYSYMLQPIIYHLTEDVVVTHKTLILQIIQLDDNLVTFLLKPIIDHIYNVHQVELSKL